MTLKKMVILIGLLLLGLLLWRTDLGQVAETLRFLSLRTLLLLLFLQLFNRSLVAVQWQQLANLHAPTVTWRQMMVLNLMGTFFEGITPSVKFGSEGFKVWWLKNHLDMNTSDGTALLLLQKTISGFGFGLTVLVTLLAGLFHSRPLNLISLGTAQNALPAPWVPALALTAAAAMWLLLRRVPLPAGLHRWLNNTGLKLRRDGAFLAANPARGIFHLLLTLVIWFNYALQAWITARGIGLTIGFWAMGTAIYLAYMAGTLPLLPGGAGTFESAMLFVLTAYGVPMGQALALTLVIRVATFWLSFGLSGIFMACSWLNQRITGSPGHFRWKKAMEQPQ